MGTVGTIPGAGNVTACRPGIGAVFVDGSSICKPLMIKMCDGVTAWNPHGAEVCDL